jgi:hypothetical protein
MEKTKRDIIFSAKHNQLRESTNTALKKVSKKLIEETKKKHGYLIFSDEDGKPKKVPAKDL